MAEISCIRYSRLESSKSPTLCEYINTHTRFLRHFSKISLAMLFFFLREQVNTIRLISPISCAGENQFSVFDTEQGPWAEMHAHNAYLHKRGP